MKLLPRFLMRKESVALNTWRRVSISRKVILAIFMVSLVIGVTVKRPVGAAIGAALGDSLCHMAGQFICESPIRRLTITLQLDPLSPRPRVSLPVPDMRLLPYDSLNPDSVRQEARTLPYYRSDAAGSSWEGVPNLDWGDDNHREWEAVVVELPLRLSESLLGATAMIAVVIVTMALSFLNYRIWLVAKRQPRLALLRRPSDGVEYLFSIVANLLPSDVREECGADMLEHFRAEWTMRGVDRWPWLAQELVSLVTTSIGERLRTTWLARSTDTGS